MPTIEVDGAIAWLEERDDENERFASKDSELQEQANLVLELLPEHSDHYKPWGAHVCDFVVSRLGGKVVSYGTPGKIPAEATY